MQVFKRKNDLRLFLKNERLKRHRIGFVPTMGAMHNGHQQLIRHCANENDITICSIFVNPVQFNNPEDLKEYPRTVEKDLTLLQSENCDAVYLPDYDDIYGLNPMRTTIHFGHMETVLEGRYRPDHFRGVGLVVAKLFHIVQPDSAYFGQKDLQQFYLIKQLIGDLSFDIDLVRVPTVREEDGLAMSSRNQRIDPEYRPLASKFYECLIKSRERLQKGEGIPEVKKFANDLLSGFRVLRLEYFEVIDIKDFSPAGPNTPEDEMAICIAGYLNNIRLIDNVMYI